LDKVSSTVTFASSSDVDDLWRIVPAVGWTCHEHAVQVQDVLRLQMTYFLNLRTFWHFGHVACSPSGA